MRARICGLRLHVTYKIRREACLKVRGKHHLANTRVTVLCHRFETSLIEERLHRLVRALLGVEPPESTPKRTLDSEFGAGRSCLTPILR